MSQVKANAGRYPPPKCSTSPTIPTAVSNSVPPPDSTRRPPSALLVAGLLAAATGALALATRAPLATTVLGLIAFGVLHNVLEIRYVAGRFGRLLTGRFLGLLLGLITGI